MYSKGQNCPNVFAFSLRCAFSPPVLIQLLLYFTYGKLYQYAMGLRGLKMIAHRIIEISRDRYHRSFGQFCPFTQKIEKSVFSVVFFSLF